MLSLRGKKAALLPCQNPKTKPCRGVSGIPDKSSLGMLLPFPDKTQSFPGMPGPCSTRCQHTLQRSKLVQGASPLFWIRNRCFKQLQRSSREIPGPIQLTLFERGLSDRRQSRGQLHLHVSTIGLCFEHERCAAVELDVGKGRATATLKLWTRAGVGHSVMS